ncbi:S8 family serine peptidase [Streptacidiphilus fuscans]|uniref:S8 family serine peptidase n=1 Tax=Streptacidiphilus fuscans TaxID=2789292 RepID=UPI002E2E229E|nr:S8 family serine peptidase [Streptacidiphilus fuscans]
MAQANDGARAAEWPLKAYGAENNLVWNHSTGKGVVVAVVDSGVRATHVDLTGQVLPGTDVAFGGNGWTDHSPQGHGTGIASLIAGHGHGPNGEDGIMGLAPGAKILPVGVGAGDDTHGNGDLASNVAEGIRYAVDHGAQVINLSLGAYDRDPGEEQAVAYAEQHNVVVVGAAGNENTSNPSYPGSFPGVIKVSAVDQNDNFWPKSDTSGITVAAAGVGIVLDGNGSDTQMVQGDGTSYATAYVSAIAALFRAAYPNLTAGQIVNRIIKTAILPAGRTAPDLDYGYGVASPDFTTNVPAGPAAGPLPQASGAPSDSSSSSSAAPVTTGTNASSGSSGSGMAIGLGAVGGVVLLVVIGVIVARTRRRGGNGGGGGEPAYPTAPHYPNAPQQPYQPPTGQYGGQSQQQPYQQMPNNLYQQQGQQPPRQQ